MAKSRVFLYILLAFIVGVAFRSFLDVPIIYLWLGFAGVAAAAVFAFSRKNLALAVWLIIFLSFLAGILRLELKDKNIYDLSSLVGRQLNLVGFVYDEPSISQNVQRIKIKITGINGVKPNPPFFTLVVTRRFPQFTIGDEIAIQGILRRPENFAAPLGGEPRQMGRDSFDYASFLAKDDVYSVVSFPLIEKIGSGKGSRLKIILSRVKNKFEEKLNFILPEPHAAFLNGLLLGDRESLPKTLVENFKKTGVTHIVALSGYNITIVSRFIIAVLVLLAIPFEFSFWIASSAVVLFVILTGASASIIRAGIMGILVLIARREGRIYSMTNALAFAGALMVFQNPKILRFDAAFQLSFLSTIGLVYISPAVERFLDKLKSRAGFSAGSNFALDKQSGRVKEGAFSFKKTLVETLSAQLAVLPLLIYLFGRVSIISPITNILVLAAVPYAMAAGFAAGALGFLWQPVSQVAGWFAWLLLEYQLRVINFFAGFPIASVEAGEWSAFVILALYFFVLFKLYPVIQPRLGAKKKDAPKI